MTVPDFAEAVEQNLEGLESLADSDNPAAPVAAALLDAYDDGGLGEP